MKAKSLVYGMIVGSTVAAIAALLVTPTSGRELRENSKTNVEKVCSSIRQLALDGKTLLEQVKKTTKVGKDTILDISSEVKDSIQDWKEEVEPALIQLRDDIESLKRTVEQTKNTFS